MILYLHTQLRKKYIMTNLKIKNNPSESVKILFISIYGFEPTTIENDGTFYWADKVGFSLIGKYVIKNNLQNGK